MLKGILCFESDLTLFHLPVELKEVDCKKVGRERMCGTEKGENSNVLLSWVLLWMTGVQSCWLPSEEFCRL